MNFETLNPHMPNDVVGEYEPAGVAGVDAAVERSNRAFGEWRLETAFARGAALEKIASDLEAEAGELAELVVREVGKPLTEARGEVARAAAILRYYGRIVLAPDGEIYPAAQSPDWLFSRRYPLGACALITPWNFPVAIPIWKAAPALGYGNTAILKPAPHGTATAERVVEIASRHLPEGSFEIVPGDAETGEPLVEHPRVAAVSFTGSASIGRSVAKKAIERDARVQCEMGGQNPSVVLEDADLDRAASTIAYAAMGYAGQKCTATSRVIAVGGIYEALKERLVAAIQDLEITEPMNESCQVGPIIDSEARNTALQSINASSGKLLTGGDSLDVDGFYLTPSLTEIQDQNDVLAREEVFAPVAALLRASSEDEALRMANAVPQGLAAAVFTNRLQGATSFADRLEAGLVKVNASTAGVDFHAPFGGVKASGIGEKEQGLAARGFYTQSRTTLVSS